jgi:hypothetical protein
MSYPESLQPSPARPAVSSSLEYARPMPPVRERMVLPRSLAMTLMICGATLTLTPAVAIAWGALSHGFSNSDGEAFSLMVLTLTGIAGLVILWFSVYLSPRVPRTGG